MSWNSCGITPAELDATVKELKDTKWDAICLQEGYRNCSSGCFSCGDHWRLQTSSGMRGATMIVLNKRLGDRMRQHSIGTDYVIAHLALSPPILLISYHAPSNSLGPEVYQASLDNLVNDIQTLGWNPASGIRLMICGDFNTQVSEHEGVVGQYTNGGERANDVPRANMILGVAHHLHLRLFSTYHQLGLTRVPWRRALAKGDAESLIDHIAATNTIKCQIQIAHNFPTLTISDHKPIQATALAPKRDRRLRKQLMENIFAHNANST